MDNPPLTNRQSFDRLLYDYFVEKGLHETAETFRRETGISIGPLSMPEIDVSNGFLRDWWLVNSDFFEGEGENTQNNEGSYRNEGNLWQQSDLTASREHELNEQMIEELTFDQSFGIILGGSSATETAPNPESIILLSSPTNHNHTYNQGLEVVIEAYLRTTADASLEAGFPAPSAESLISSSAPANPDIMHYQELYSVVQAVQRTTTIASSEVGLAVLTPGILMPSFLPINQCGRDNQGIESVAEAFLMPTGIASNESQNGGKRKMPRVFEDGSIDMLGASNNQLGTSSPFGDIKHQFELAEEDRKGHDNKFNLPTYLVNEKNDEGKFSNKRRSFKLSSSLMEEKQEDAGSSIKDDTVALSSLATGNIEEGDSSSQDAYMHDSSQDNGNGYDYVMSAVNIDERHKPTKNAETTGVTVGGNLAFKTMSNAESLTWSSAPANLDGTDTLGLHSVVQTILGTTEIASTESGEKTKCLGDPEDGSIDKYQQKTSQVPMDLDDLSELHSHFVKIKEDQEGASFRETKINNLFAEKKEEEGAFSGKEETFKPISSVFDKKKDNKGGSSTKNDTFEPFSFSVEGKEDKEGDSTTRGAYLYGSSHSKGNQDDGMIFSSCSDQHDGSPK